MRHRSLKLMAVLWLGLGLTVLKAQETIPAAGGNASGGGGSLDYTVGQVVYQTHTGVNGSIAEGIQQSYEISVVTSNEEAFGIILSVSAYPNPATDYLQLEVENEVEKDISFQLYDVKGNLLQSRKIVSNQTRIDMNGLAAATYFVKITQENKVVKTFKIIKLK